MRHGATLKQKKETIKVSKTKVIAFANNKGGSGKSTCASNVGYAMSILGKRVLLIDADMQLNLTLSFFDEEQTMSFVQNGENIYTAVKEEADAAKFIKNTEYKNLDLIPSSTLMSSIEYELYPKKNRDKILQKVLKPIIKSEKYDYILIDSPPTLGGWVANILFAGDFVLIPVEASPWGLFGLANMFDFCFTQAEAGAKAKILGIAVTKADTRKNYFKQTMDTLRESDVAYVFENYIRLDSNVEWSQDNSKPVVAYKRYSRSAIEYIELAKEIMERANR